MDAIIVLEKFEKVLLELNRLKSQTGAPDLDEMDLELYGDALRPLKTVEQIDQISREIRRSCKFCPTAAEVSEIVAKITGRDLSVPPHVADSRRIVSASAADQEERKLQQITGISAETAAANRERARGMMAKLLQEKPVNKSFVFGEVPEHLRPELEQLAEKRREIERRFPALASEGK